MWWREQQLYGSSRLGMWRPSINLANANASSDWGTYGKKFFELSNHLGNVMVIINDNRQYIDDIYQSSVISANDYYAYGGQMQGRSFTLNNNPAYRYGFNGKENDNEIKGQGNQQDYGMRIYDPRIGKFLSVDPITSQYPMLTPYQFASNTPIQAIDLDGGEAKMVNTRTGKVAEGPLDLTKYPSSDGWKLAYLRITNHAISPITINNPHKEIIAAPDMYGRGHVGEKSVILSNIKVVQDEYTSAVGENIKGGVFGALGYYAAKERGSFVGAIGDQVLMSFAGVGGEPRVFPKSSIYRNSPILEVNEVKPLEESINIMINFKQNWSLEQRIEAYDKAKAISDDPSTKVVKNPMVRPPNLRKTFINAGGVLKPGQQVDHTIDLQINGNNGADGKTNLKGLNGSVNTSFGSQINKQIKNLPDNTRVNKVLINPFIKR